MIIRISAAALLLAVAACTPAPTEEKKPETPPPAAQAPVTPAAEDPMPAAIDALAVTYDVTITGDVAKTCKLTLMKDMTAIADPTCHAALPGLDPVARWAATSTGSFSLKDKADAVLGDFSPSQDAAVYFRGSIGGKLYELKPPQ